MKAIPFPAGLAAKVPLAAVSGQPSFRFPWEGLVGHLTAQPEAHLPLVGYGSLLSLASAQRTIRQADTVRTPCIEIGCRRVFNYRMPDRVLKRYAVPPGSRERAALNVVVTQDPQDVINGVLITVKPADIPALREREFGYDLIPVSYLPWNPVAGEALNSAYVLSAPDAAWCPAYQVTDPTILPQPDYAQLCEDAAGGHSPEFHQMYLETTYLADKQTLWKHEPAS